MAEVTFRINVVGEAVQVVDKLQRSLQGASGEVNKLSGGFSGFQAKLVAINQATQMARDFASSLRDASGPGMALNSSLTDLSALTGVVGKGLQEIEGYARATAKTFGVDAAQAAESYKLILGQLTPEIAKSPVALDAMGRSAATLAKTMNNDLVAATGVLTTAMNQYQVSTDDPIAASEEMSRMMNVMAAAAREGSSELPFIAQALENSGMAAKAANISFEETNAAIQVLDKAGKKGAEGGVALRNVMATLSEGRFLPKEVQAELTAAGVNMSVLTDNTRSLSERLRALSPIAGDAALITKLFGTANSNAALALMSGTDLMDQYAKAITGTTAAEEQAAVVMTSRAEQMARVQAKVDDLKISFFNLTGSLVPYTAAITDGLVPLAQMIPLVQAAGKGAAWMASMENLRKVATVSSTIATKAAAVAMGALNAVMSANPIAIVVVAVAAVAAAVYAAWQRFEGFRKAVLGTWGVIKEFGSALKTHVTDSFAQLLGGLGKMGQAFVQFFSGDFRKAIATAKDGVADLAGSAVKLTPAGMAVGAVKGGDYKGAWQAGADKGAASWAARTTQDAREAEGAVAAVGQAAAGAAAQLTGAGTAGSNAWNKVTEDGLRAGTAYGDIALKIEAVKKQIEQTKTGDTQRLAILQAQLAELTAQQEALQRLGSTDASTIYGDIAAKMETVKAEIAQVKIGEESRLATLQLQLQMLEKQEEKLREIGRLKEISVPAAQAVNLDLPAMDDPMQGEDIQQIATELQAMDTQAINANAHIRNMHQSVADLTGTSMTFGEALAGSMERINGTMAAGAESFAEYGKNIKNMIRQEIMGLISRGVAALVSGALMKASWLPGGTFMAPALAAVAAGVAKTAFASLVPAFANGGLVYGDTLARVGEYPGASTNPEVIAPLSKLRDLMQPGFGGEVRFIIEGTNLVGILNKESRKNRFM